MNHPAQNPEPQINRSVTLGPQQSFLDLYVKRAVVVRELEIMAAAQAGSTTAFDELQRSYSRPLFKAIFRITKNREDAEDALQDTFLRAYMALRHFEGRSSVYSWLMRIAINSALMVLRRRRKRPDGFLDSSFEDADGYPAREITDTALNPEQRCELNQRTNLLLCAIAKLETNLRTPIEIQLSNEPSMKEIANALNISVAAAKARLHRARLHLAKRVYLQSHAKKYRSVDSNNRHVIAHSHHQEQPCRCRE